MDEQVQHDQQWLHETRCTVKQQANIGNGSKVILGDCSVPIISHMLGFPGSHCQLRSKVRGLGARLAWPDPEDAAFASMKARATSATG